MASFVGRMKGLSSCGFSGIDIVPGGAGNAPSAPARPPARAHRSAQVLKGDQPRNATMVHRICERFGCGGPRFLDAGTAAPSPWGHCPKKSCAGPLAPDIREFLKPVALSAPTCSF